MKDVFFTYSEYQNMGGTLEEHEFRRFFIRAENKMQEIAFGRITAPIVEKHKEKLQYLAFDLIDFFSNAPTGGSVVSESNQGMSRTFSSVSATESQNFVYSMCHSVLSQIRAENGQKLTYMGVTT